MHTRDFSGKSVCILGFGREGRAMAEALKKYAPGCRISVADRNEQLTMDNGQWKNVSFQLGERYLENLDSFDVVIKSPGIPPLPELKAHNSKLITSTQIFFDSIAESGAIVIGVTGSKGKSTTSSLIFEILKKAGKDAYLIGNIGSPAIGYIERSKKNTIFVQEMSSAQLSDLTKSPQIAVVTAFFPEHLDYHGSLEAYQLAKTNIARFQNKNDAIFFNSTSAECKAIAAKSIGEKIPFSVNDAPVRIEETRLIGNHNLSNIAAAFLVSRRLGIPDDVAIHAIKEFRGLPHRLESLGIHHGIEWIDDSISTTPESAIAALDALGNRVATLILGGLDRGYDFTSLAQRLKQSSVQTAILLPDSGSTIRKAIAEAGAKMKCIEVKTMEETVTQAIKCTTHDKPLTTHSPIVLLSPASPSYGMFKNFEDRGNQFRKYAEKKK